MIEGIKIYNERYRKLNNLTPVNTSFFQYHFEIESGHGANVMNELEETFNDPKFDQEKWLSAGQKALDAIHTFWFGLEETRKTL